MADNDDYEDMTITTLANPEPLVSLGQTSRRAATHSVPDMMIRRALSTEQEQKLRRDKTTTMVILAPNTEWVSPLLRAGKALGDWKFAHAATEQPRKANRSDAAADQAIFAMSGGGRILGVSQDLSYLPSAMVASADIVLEIAAPDNEIIANAIRHATGRTPRSMPANLSQGLDYGDICGAIRHGSSAKSCVERLVAAGKSKTKGATNLADVPPLEALHGYGEAMDWAQGLLMDLEAWRQGSLDFAAIERTAVLASAPGLGKTTFVRSLAKSAGLPFFPTSVSAWFSNSPGYLDSVIKQIDQVFAEAAAVAPAVIFLDEIEGLPNRATSDRHSSWWTPVIGHMLLKLDSAASGVTSKLIIIGATNHPEKLDAALVRPGRLSKIIHIENPTAESLQGIMRQHLGNDLPNVDLEPLAKMAVGSTGADVFGWVKSARTLARQAQRPVEIGDLIAQIAPPDNRSPKLVRRIAVHEAAHAVVGNILRPGSVNSVSIISTDAQTGGQTSSTTDFADLITRSDVEASATIYLAGRCGEQVLLNSVSSGAGGDHSSDLGRATFLLAQIHTTLGLGSKLLHRAAPRDVMQLLSIDVNLAKVVEDDLQRLHTKALAMVEHHSVIVDAVANELMIHRHLTREHFASVFETASRNVLLMVGGEAHG